MIVDDIVAKNMSDSNALPSFFSTSLVDDAKYENLLADLRAHDLLGSDDFKATTGLFPSSGGIFSTAISTESTENETRIKPPSNVKAPPGFNDSHKGVAPTKAGRCIPNNKPCCITYPFIDLEWARGQHEYAQLQQEYQLNRKSTKSMTFSAGHGLGLGIGLSGQYREEPDDESKSAFDMDETQMAQLGLDDDDGSVTGGSPARSPVRPKATGPRPPPKLPPPLPQSQPPPPMPPRGWPHAPPPPQPHVMGNGPTWQHQQPTGRPLPNAAMPPPSGPWGGQSGQQPPLPAGPPPPSQHFKAKLMTSRDFHFVLNQQMKQLRCSDPFSDDYYYHNFIQVEYADHILLRFCSPLLETIATWGAYFIRWSTGVTTAVVAIAAYPVLGPTRSLKSVESA